MSTYGINVPSPDEINYHEARQQRRIAAEPDPKAHPLYHMVCWHLEKCLTPMDGGQFFDRFLQLVLQAIDTCLDDVLARED